MPRNFCAIAPFTVSVPRSFPQYQLSTMNEWLRARMAASIWMFPGPPLLLQSVSLLLQLFTGW